MCSPSAGIRRRRRAGHGGSCHAVERDGYSGGALLLHLSLFWQRRRRTHERACARQMTRVISEPSPRITSWAGSAWRRDYLARFICAKAYLRAVGRRCSVVSSQYYDKLATAKQCSAEERRKRWESGCRSISYRWLCRALRSSRRLPGVKGSQRQGDAILPRACWKVPACSQAAGTPERSRPGSCAIVRATLRVRRQGS